MFEKMLDELEVGETLSYLRDRRAAADREEALLLAGVAHFLDLHTETADPDEWWLEEIGGERDVPLAGDGTPRVAEFARVDLATQLRLTEGAARSLAGDTLELRHRLPRVWARIQTEGTGSLQAWRGRRIVAETTHLSPKAVDWLDRQVAPVAHKISYGRLMKLIAAAILRFDPVQADKERTNLGRLCRFHHRVKTHSTWRYERLADGSYLWTNPAGEHWIVDQTGTRQLTVPDAPAA